MKNLLIISIMIIVSAYGQNIKKENKKELTQIQMQKQMEKEKKYAQERTFYQMDNYDFKGAEVNPESLDSVPDLELDDLDMDSVYD